MAWKNLLTGGKNMKLIKKIKNKILQYLFFFKEYQISILSKNKFKPNFSTKKQQKLIKLIFQKKLGYKLNLKNPQTFNEKLQWLKLFYHDPLMTQCADKYLMRKYVKKVVNDKHLTLLLGVYDDPEKINFDQLPKSFVIKVNWGSGQNIIVKNKNKLNIEETKTKLKEWLEHDSNHYFFSFEWPYKNIQPKIVIEEYIEKKNEEKYDYKIFCFYGEPKFFYITKNGHDHSKMSLSHYDTNFNQLLVKLNHYSFIEDKIFKPNYYQEMLNIAKKLAHPFPFCRVDFFNFKDDFYIGELTFYPAAAIGNFKPVNWDLKFGNFLQLPKKRI